MDLLETTMKVIENRSIARETVTLFKQDLSQYENYIDQLKTIASDIQSENFQNTEALEVNNLTKDSYNENFPKSKVLFRTIYGYAQQIEENLITLAESEDSLRTLFDENNRRLTQAEATLTDTLKIIDMMKTNVKETFLKEDKDIQEMIEKMNANIKERETLCENLLDQNEGKQKDAQSVKTEIELLEDKIENHMKLIENLIEEQCEYDEEILKYLQNETEMKNKMLQFDETILQLSEELEGVIKQKEEVGIKLKTSQKLLQQFDQQCSSVEVQIAMTEFQQEKSLKSLAAEIELKSTLLHEKETKLVEHKNKTIEIKEEMQRMTSLQAALDEKLTLFQQDIENFEQASCENILDKIIKEHEDLFRKSENLLTMMPDNDNNIIKLQDQLNVLRNTPNEEVAELKKEIQGIEEEIEENVELKQDIEKLKTRNKSLQENIKRYETVIAGLAEQKHKLETKRDESHNNFKMLSTNFENLKKEILRLEMPKGRHNSKFFPEPSPQKVTKSQSLQLAEKRSKEMDMESDSSVDGEALSYAEFMAKKNKLKENKRPRKQ